MTRYAVVLMLDSDEEPGIVLAEIVSTLEFDHRTTVRQATLLNEEGEELAKHEPEPTR